MTDTTHYTTREDIERADMPDGHAYADAVERLSRQLAEAQRRADDARRRAEILALEDRRHALILSAVQEAIGTTVDGAWPDWSELGPSVRALRERAEEAEAALASVRSVVLDQLDAIEADAREGHEMLVEAMRRAAAAELRAVAS